MLSLQQAIEIKESILAYLKATFTFQDKEVHKAFYDFVNHPTDGMFKGPYLTLSLPFVKANKEAEANIPLDIKPSWAPYDHQVKAWYRLSTQDQKPQPTIITTGTGSGKTEGFMYPVLDYCHKNIGKMGIKVIILYPMNALATDQAKRLAEMIFEDDRLKGKITSGLFIGEGKDSAKYPKSMGPYNIIENRESILSSPPDILLTNFKMLDYGLMKNNYHDLWLGNLKDNSLLQFLVLDELHTYDGAQGTDVANLIRRLKLKLNIPKGYLCPVGTSATIGSGDDAADLLSKYAVKIFGEKIDNEGIIVENRQSPEDFFNSEEDLETFLPRANTLIDLKPNVGEGYKVYIERQIRAWQLDKDALSEELKSLKIVKDLVTVINEDKGVSRLEDVIQSLSHLNSEFKAVPQRGNHHAFNPKEALIQSLFSLISEAKEYDSETKRSSPFLFTNTQLWIRELSGVLRAFEDKPRFTWKDHISVEEEALSLPPWFCRECGASGWLGVKHDNKERFEKEINDVYTKFFSNHKHVFLINRTRSFSQIDAANVGYEATDQFQRFVYGRNLGFYDESEPGRVNITAFRKLGKNGYSDHVCPECNTKNTISIIGTRVGTLSSIAVSQTLSSDLDSQSEKQRKVLGFTNSVQDAAHQAGFIEARNYSFTFRSSLQKLINDIGEPTNLYEIANKFVDYWKLNSDESGDKPLDAYYYRFYPKDYLGKSSPKDYSDNGRYEVHFQKEFDERIRWEVYSEFGYNAIIGRTLEKTVSSGVYFNKEALGKVWDSVKLWLHENEPSHTIDKQSFIRFLNLMLHRIRVRGAIDHPYLVKFRENRLNINYDLNWIKDSRHFLNRKFGSNTRIPRLLTHQKDASGVIDSTSTKKVNWFHSYFRKNFNLASNHVDLLNEFYEKVINALDTSEVLDRKTAKDTVNFAINPKAIIVSKDVYQYECDTCGDSLHVSTDDDIEGGSCLKYRCSGHYRLLEGDNIAPNYYQLVYNRNRSPRIYAADHTGLLDRKSRELLEIDFKERKNFNSKNAMIATSTLEMGIDIGSLNVAFNNSVPPLPSNFLQRIGRAGRSSGSALLLNFAQSKAHDLFYFKDPMEMMAGNVHTPGCYLEAKEILKRHFFAYCIDSWTSDNPSENGIPVRIKYLKLEINSVDSLDFFINKILNFLKNRQQEIFERFKFEYKDDVGDEVFEELRLTLESGQFYTFHKTIFKYLVNEIHFIREKIRDLEKRVKHLNLGKGDPERDELEKEVKNLRGLINSIKARNTLEYLTNVGALPNYAFPETGVTLNAKVLGNKAAGGVKPPMDKDFEIVRSANQALREFAPDNYFYSQGFRFLISGINTFDWSKESNYHNKRFCSNCDHIENADIASGSNCPKCGDESWSASSNVHKFAKLVSVKSYNNRANATLSDSKDDREKINYNTGFHFNFSKNKSFGAWAMKEVPFGIEFVKNVIIIESNLGRVDANNSRKVKINENEVPAHGFITCKYCGKSSSNINQNDYKEHYAYCKHKDVEYDGEANDVFEEIFLFRELETEVLKVLLPVQEFNNESEIKMFRAGIELGLKKYFKGNPQHINIANYREFNHRTQKFDQYLVLYDAIPGGTGYLEKLFGWKEFSELLKIAYHEIASCSCQYEGKDGCYRCIYSYGNQYYQEELSRARAEKRFGEIVKRCDAWERQSNGLSNITNLGNIEESELEERFIRSLKNMSKHNDYWSFRQENEDGVNSYYMTFSKEQTTIDYHIRPQVSLGSNDGVAYNTIPDFLIVCTNLVIDGKTINPNEIRRISIYMDGYQYHASNEHNRFSNDFDKRQAIIASPEYMSWTLTWDDVERFDKQFNQDKNQSEGNDFLSDLLLVDSVKKVKTQLLKSIKGDKPSIIDSNNSFDRLVKLLENPKSYLNWSLFFGLFQNKLFMPSFDPDNVENAFSNISNQVNYCIQKRTTDGLVPFNVIPENNLFDLKVLTNIKCNKVYCRLSFINTNVIDKYDWNSFWILYNLLQFYNIQPVKEDGDSSFEEESFADYIDLYDEEYRKVLLKMYEEGLIKTEQDEELIEALLDEKGEVIASAGLIIHYLKIFVNPASDMDRKVFAKAAYKEIDIIDLNKIEI